MKPIEFEEQTCVFAKDQPEYLPLPVHKSDDGRVISCWKFSLRERLRVLFGAKMWFHMFTFNQPLQPQRPTLDYPFEVDKDIAGVYPRGKPVRGRIVMADGKAS